MRGVADVERLSARSTRMDDSINPFEHRDVDCSGRSLATVLVAWVGAAMVASVLLRWKYMWIALTILTLLFLFACGFAACNARRTRERIILSEEAGIIASRGRDRSIPSVSGSVDNYPEVTDPPAYQAYWITDLPPPYAVAVGAEQAPPTRPGRSSDSGGHTGSTDCPRLSNPPPYSVAILSEINVSQTNSSQATRVAETSLPERPHPRIDEATNSRRDRALASALARDDDKNETEQSSNEGPNSQAVRPSGTLYLSNIISCNFGQTRSSQA